MCRRCAYDGAYGATRVARHDLMTTQTDMGDVDGRSMPCLPGTMEVSHWKMIGLYKILHGYTNHVSQMDHLYSMYAP